MKAIIKYGLPVLFLAGISACEPSLDKDLPAPKSYLVADGVKSISLFDLRSVNVESDVYQLPIQCSGKGNVNVKATLKVNPARLAEYNLDKLTNYQALPEDCYKIANYTVDFNSKEESGLLEVNFNYAKLQELIGYENENYVLPIELTDANGIEVNTEKNFIMVNPYLQKPYVQLSSTGLKDITLGKGGTQKASFKLQAPFNTPVATKFQITIDQELLGQYNEENQALIEMMPTNAYTLKTTELAIQAGKSETDVEYVFTATDELQYGNYMLPLRITNVENYPLQGSDELMYLITYLPSTIDRSNWEILKGSEITQSGDGGGIPAILDGNINSYWHAAYSPHADAPYELVFDMKDTYEVLRFEVVRRQTNYSPAMQSCKISIALSEDNVNWKTFDDVTVVYSADYQGFNITATKARYVKYIHKTDSYAVGHMAEFQLRGVKAD